MKYRLFSMFIALMLLCSLLSGCSGNANAKETATGKYESLVTEVNQTRIDYMRSQLNADDELIDRMSFTYYVPKEESSDSSLSYEMYTSSLGETIFINSENGQLKDIEFITPLCPPLTRDTDSDRVVARFLGLSDAVILSELLLGGSVESGNAAATQLINELYVNSNSTIETENMRIEFYGYTGNMFFPNREDWKWQYVFKKK